MTHPWSEAARPDRVARAAVHVDNQFFRALTVLRAVTLVFAVGINAARWRDFEHPVSAWVLVAAMTAWSALVTWLYDVPERRRTWVFVADMAVTMALLASTAYVETSTMLAEHDSTLTSYWVCTAVLCCATRWGVAGGLVASVLVSAVDVTLRPEVTSSTVGNVFLLVLAGLTIGYCATAVRVSAIGRSNAERAAAVASERERLARAVHDGVLQVLAMVQRRGAEIGGPTSELARLAGEQEAALRALVQSTVAPTEEGPAEVADVGAALNALSTPQVSVATPSRPVLLPRETVTELVAVVLACKDNVLVHVGPTAPLWILLELAPEHVVVSVRDDGPGISTARLAEAEAEGRMGVVKSIRGRIADLGGESELISAPGEGTEWEFRLPLRR